MLRLRTVLMFTALGLLAACGGGSDDDDDTMTADAAASPDGPSGPDATPAPDAPMGTPDAGTSDAEPQTASDQIADARAAADGAVSIAIEGAFVTYVKPAVGSDPAGFFLQYEQAGPALFVAVDPSTLTPSPAVGDEVTLTVTEMGTTGLLRQAIMVSDVSVASSGNDLSGLVQDVSAAGDLVTALGSYDSELVTISGTIAADFAFAGGGHQSAQLDTAGVTGSTDLKLRVPDDVLDAADLANGCVVTVGPTPLWRFNAQAQPSAWDAAEISVTSCPAPTVLGAVAASSTEVIVSFDRRIDAASLVGDGSQFTFDNGLTASAVALNADGRSVTVTTSLQVVAVTYTVTVADTVTDTVGTGVAAGSNTAMFGGFEVPAVLRINELNADIANGCDLIELRVITGGQMAGIVVRERVTTVHTFASMVVAAGDIIVVHFDSGDTTNCNTASAVSETVSIAQQPVAAYPGNYDTAWDIWIDDTGITNTENVITVVSATATILDVVLVTNDPARMDAAGPSETAAATAADAGEWVMVGGGVPTGGFVDGDFNAHAAPDLDDTGTSAAGESIQRNDDGDNNDKDDWTQAASSWGLRNAGQTAP